MAVFQLGPIIRNRREELGLSQEDLADGVCSVPTLSRIENGERMPTKDHFEMLMQRLGYCAMSLDFFTDKQDFLLYELKFKIRQAYVARKFSEAEKYLDEFRNLLGTRTQIDQQFLILYQILLHKDQYTNSERLKRFETALRLTCQRYNKSRIPHILSYEEIVLLNNIAICYEHEGDRSQAISILISLKEYYEHHVVNTEEALRTQPMILYNLSKYLGQDGDYARCIEVCDLGIQLARTTGRCPLLGKTLYNRGWALAKRAQPGDIEASQYSMRQAYYFAVVMGSEYDMRNCKKFWETHFPTVELK